MIRLATALAVLIATGAPSLGAEATKDLVPHRATYEVKLAGGPRAGSITAASGKLVLEFVGEACTGFTTTMRLVTQVVDGEGKTRLTDIRSTMREDGAGSMLDFLTQTFVDQQLASESKGIATRKDGGVEIALERPQQRALTVESDVIFPTEQTARIIDAARAGQRTVELTVYEGSENGEKVFLTTTVIGREQTADDVGQETAAQPLQALKHWPVTVSYFDREKKQGEDTPDTQLSFILYENGVTRKLRLDYGDFALEGRLTDFAPLDRKPCP